MWGRLKKEDVYWRIYFVIYNTTFRWLMIQLPKTILFEKFKYYSVCVNDNWQANYCFVPKSWGGGRIKCTKWEIIKTSKNSGELLLGHSLIIVEKAWGFFPKDCNLTPSPSFTISQKSIACYLVQYFISSSFYIFPLFLSLKGSSNITAKQI